jgi:membrane protease YdiL (CAAX protease family)
MGPSLDGIGAMENRFSRWQALGRVLLFMIACAVLLGASMPFARGFPGLPAALVIGTVASIGTFVLTVIFVRWEGLTLQDVGGAVGKVSPLRLVIGLLIGLLLVALHVAILGFAGHVSWIRSEGVGFRAIATSLVIYLLLSCREELAFHGYPLRRLNSLFGLWVSQFVVAAVFALEHVAGGSTWVSALFGAAVGSLLFGMAAIATRGLAVPIGLHAAWNLGDWMHGGKDSTGLWHQVPLPGFRDRADRVGMIGYVVVTIAATLFFFWWYRRTIDKTEVWT